MQTVSTNVAEKRSDRGVGPRVVFVVPCEPQGSEFIFAKRQVTALEKAGVVAERFFLRSRTSPTILAAEFCRFRKIIGQCRPQIVHAHFGTMTALFCAMATPTPLVITYHGSDLNPLKGSNWLRHSCARLMSQIASLRASQIICVSEQLKSRLWWPQVATRAHVLPLGIEMDIFPLITKNEARKALGWNEDAKIIVFNAGRMHQRSNKRLDLAQAAVQVAQGLVEGIQFVVLDGSVTPERIPLVMNGADCLLVTSDYEGSPTIVKEAMACNLPVVSVDVGDVRERLRNVYPSRIVVRDPELLGRAMNDVLALKCRSNGREIVECDLSERVVVQKTLDVYNRVLQSSQRTR